MRASFPAALLLLLALSCDRRRAPADPPREDLDASRGPSASPADHPRPPRVLTRPARAGAPGYLVVLLHGVGASADDLMPLADSLGSSLPHAEFLLPDGLFPYDGAPTGRQWFSFNGAPRADLPLRVRRGAADLEPWIDEQLASRRLSPEHLVLIGFSQGAMVAASLGVHRSSSPLAVVSLSGRFSEDAPATTGATALPVLLVHGARDRVLPVALASESAAALQAAGARVTVRIHPELAHGIDDLAVTETRAFLTGVIPDP